jgi:hypothetical protein
MPKAITHKKINRIKNLLTRPFLGEAQSLLELEKLRSCFRKISIRGCGYRVFGLLSGFNSISAASVKQVNL